MAITEKIVRHLPEFYQAQLRQKLLYKLIDLFGLQLLEVENSFAEIIKSHCIDYADLNRPIPHDLARVGALVNVLPGEQEETGAFRRRVRNTVRLYLGGLGTSDALIRGSALTFNLDVPRMSYPDGKEVIMRPESVYPQTDSFTTVANLYQPKSAPLFDEVNFDSDKGFEKSLWMKVIDNPPLPQRLIKGIWHGQNWHTFNNSVIDSPLNLELHASFRSLKFPAFTNRSKGTILRFLGIVPKGQVLDVSIQNENIPEARMNGSDVTQFLEIVKGALFDRDRFDLGYFAGEKVLPLVPKKMSRWHFRVASALFAADEMDSGTVFTASGARFVADDADPGSVLAESRFDTALFAVDQKDMFDQAFFELMEVGEFDENKLFGGAGEKAGVVFGGTPFAEVHLNWKAREPSSFQIHMSGPELLDVAELEIRGAFFSALDADWVVQENRFDSGRFAVDPRDRLILNVGNIKAAGIKAAVIFQ